MPFQGQGSIYSRNITLSVLLSAGYVKCGVSIRIMGGRRVPNLFH